MDDFTRKIGREIRNIAKTGDFAMPMTSRAVKLTCKCVLDLNSDLIQECLKKKYAKGKNHVVMPVEAACKAVHNIFPGKMQNHAHIQGLKNLSQFNSGVLVYKPQVHKATIKARKDQKAKIQIQPIYTKGIPVIVKLLNPDIVVSNECKKLVALILQKVCEITVSKAQESSAGKKLLTASDIAQAVDNIMSANMGKHAVSEGARNVVLFLDGQTKYKPEKYEALNRTFAKRKKKNT